MKLWRPALVALAVIGVAGVIGANWAKQPSTTRSSNQGTQDQQDVLGTSNSLTPFTSPYFHTQIPSDLQLKTSTENPKAAVMAAYLFTHIKPSLSDHLAISVGKLGLNRLTEIPGVKQRLNDPQAYQQVPVSGAPDGAMSFTRTTRYETAVFWRDGGNYIAVVVSGQPQRQSELDQTLQTVLTNWSAP